MRTNKDACYTPEMLLATLANSSTICDLSKSQSKCPRAWPAQTQSFGVATEEMNGRTEFLT